MESPRARTRTHARAAMMILVQNSGKRVLCAARLRNGEQCQRVVPRSGGSAEFCPGHAKMIDSGIEAAALRRGEQPPRRARAALTVTADDDGFETSVVADVAGVEYHDPRSIRPSLARLAVANLSELQQSLIDAALSAST